MQGTKTSNFQKAHLILVQPVSAGLDLGVGCHGLSHRCVALHIDPCRLLQCASHTCDSRERRHRCVASQQQRASAPAACLPRLQRRHRCAFHRSAGCSAIGDLDLGGAFGSPRLPQPLQQVLQPLAQRRRAPRGRLLLRICMRAARVHKSAVAHGDCPVYNLLPEPGILPSWRLFMGPHKFPREPELRSC